MTLCHFNYFKYFQKAVQKCFNMKIITKKAELLSVSIIINNSVK